MNGDTIEESGAELRKAAREADAAVAQVPQQARGEVREEATRWWRWGILAAVLAAVLTTVPISLLAINKANQGAADAAALKAGDAASSEVTSARSSSLLVVRRDFATANNALIAAGLTPVPDPGTAASAYQISIATGEALGTLRAAGELEKRGVALPGVRAPDPAGGNFPDLVDGSAPAPR